MGANEIWRAVPDYEADYEVSSFGHVRSLERLDGNGRRRPAVLLKPEIDGDGYRKVLLSVDKARKKFFVHRLVALAFLPSRDEAQIEINHVDGNKANNKVANLEWITKSGNRQHALKVLNVHMGPPARPIIGSRGSTEIYLRSAVDAPLYGFNRNAIAFCLKGQRRHHRGYTWRYAD